jgi:DNA-binding NtrC family response regulator
LKALDACGGNRTHAAARIGISVRTLQRKIQQWGIGSRNESPSP